MHAVRTGLFPPALIKELRASVKRLRGHLKANDKAKYIDEDVSFHAALARATGNLRLCDVLENIQNQIWLFRRKTYVLSSTTAPDAHDGVVDALEKEDRPAAEALMSRHISSVRKTLLEHLAKDQTVAEKSAARKLTLQPGLPESEIRPEV